MIVRMLFGSHLYGTDTPASDHDYKGVFLPTARECFLGRIPKSLAERPQKEVGEKNTSEDVDVEIFSLQNFLSIACAGEMVSMDMLHAPDDMLLETSPIWEKIRSERSRFYTKDMRAFVGYARKQAAKYGIRGSRLDTMNKVIEILGTYDPTAKVGDIGALYTLKTDHYDVALPFFSVCGKKYEQGVRVAYMMDSISRSRDSYGTRAQLASENQGIDWKAVSHAVRAALQIKEMFEDDTMTLPLKQAELVKQIKTGQLDYTTVVAPMLEGLMETIEKLAQDSSLPQSVDRQYWDDFICEVYDGQD